jgi:hypothetical protein
MPGFVFVVCGDESYIKTLNFSLQSLRRFTINNVIVVTDLSRNNAKIDHENIIDVPTPKNLTNHQASIFLKTSLHNYVNVNEYNCYLDSDVIALNKGVDEIFKHSYGPVTFAADHCRLKSFSPYAVNCGCLERKNKNQNEFISVIKKIIPDYQHDAIFNNNNGRELFRILSRIKKNPIRNYHKILKYIVGRFLLKDYKKTMYFGSGISYNSKKRCWVDYDGNIITYELSAFSGEIKRNSGFNFNILRRTWVNDKKENIFFTYCNHLAESIQQEFDIEINKQNIQHWNGGVFLFNKNSIEFLNTWHQYTMAIFNKELWKTRDQGTLAATMLKYGLQNQKTLPLEFNFIADYYDPIITFNISKGFTNDNYKRIIKPRLIHIYHEFGNKNWDIWQGVEHILKAET